MERKLSFSSSSSPPAKKYDVFLSFRGEDTRNNFTGHLSLALRKIGLFNIFKDDYSLDKGKDIGPELMKAIEDSHYAVIVLSENYATSSWCLKELTKIVECMGDSGRIRTIFYHVDPSNVRNVNSQDKRKQKGSFWKALKEHAKNPSHSKDLESWRNALEKVANQSGHPIKKDDQKDDAIFIEEFVTKISSELGASIRTIEGLFGMTSRLKNLDSCVLRSSATNNVCFIGIHGMGGIGKSTLARAYYKRMSHKFDSGSFLQNIREVCDNRANGLVDLQKQLLSNILKVNFGEIECVDDGIDMIKSRLRHKKVLIVLDDISNLDQLNGLTGEDNWFGSGSVILATTREDSFLKIKKYAIYRAEYLNHSEALQLFSSKAFGSIEPPKEYKELSIVVLEYASYLPLALTVLGSLLGSKKTSEWKSALRRLKNCPEKKIVEKLKISFDDLNEIDQHIFLDIACFFIGFEKDKVIQILESYYFDIEYGISNLIDKSLLSIDQDGEIWMHDLLAEMGKDIVRKEYGNEPRRKSRICDVNDFYHILENKEGTNEVEAIVIEVYDETREYSFEGLSSMKKLRLLKVALNLPPIYYDTIVGEGPELSNNLQYLDWEGFAYTKFPPGFQPRKLVQLKLCRSKIRQLWDGGIEPLYNLKVIDLTSSIYFTKFEDFTVVPNLEKLILYNCRELSEIHPSIRHLHKLILLDLSKTGLTKLPEEINGLASLQTLRLYCCYYLKTLPNNFEQLTSLRNLDIKGSRIKPLPSSIFLMENLESVYCDDEKMIETAIRKNIISYRTTSKCSSPGWLCTEHKHWPSTLLTRLKLIDCNLTEPEAFPEYFGKLVNLEYLNLSKNPFSVPPCINGLSRLTSLVLAHCKSLRRLESKLLPSSLREVDVRYCTSLASFLDPLKPCHLRCSFVSCYHCTELVKRQDVKMTALASLTRFLEDPSKRRDENFQFSVPQSDNELPSWFINQSSTASISVTLDPNRHNSELIGFAMVFCFRVDSSMKHNFSYNIRVRCSTNWETTMDVGIVKSTILDHLFLMYGRFEDTLIECIKQVEPQSCNTLEFSFLDHDDEQCSSYGSWSVRLVYEEDIEELKKITHKYINNNSPDQEDVQCSHSQSMQVSKLRHMGQIGSPLWTGLRGVLDLEDNLELAQMQLFAIKDPHNAESNYSMDKNTHIGVFRNYTEITTKFLDKVEENPSNQKVISSNDGWASSISVASQW